jgi:hypothetical protein
MYYMYMYMTIDLEREQNHENSNYYFSPKKDLSFFFFIQHDYSIHQNKKKS